MLIEMFLVWVSLNLTLNFLTRKGEIVILKNINCSGYNCECMVIVYTFVSINQSGETRQLQLQFIYASFELT